MKVDKVLQVLSEKLNQVKLLKRIVKVKIKQLECKTKLNKYNNNSEITKEYISVNVKITNTTTELITLYDSILILIQSITTKLNETQLLLLTNPQSFDLHSIDTFLQSTHNTYTSYFWTFSNLVSSYCIYIDESCENIRTILESTTYTTLIPAPVTAAIPAPVTAAIPAKPNYPIPANPYPPAATFANPANSINANSINANKKHMNNANSNPANTHISTFSLENNTLNDRISTNVKHTFTIDQPNHSTTSLHSNDHDSFDPNAIEHQSNLPYTNNTHNSTSHSIHSTTSNTNTTKRPVLFYGKYNH